ncbi:MAG: hypothetical protein ABIQ31_00030 [Ferruginibacter sp.]
MKNIYLLVLVFFLSGNVIAQNIGIRTLTPQSALDINGDLALRPGSITLGVSVADNIDLATTPYSFYNLMGVGFRSMSGFSGGKDGRVVTLHNASNYSFTLLNNSAASLPENQIVIPGGASINILSGGSVTMMYSRLTSKWNIVSSIFTSGQEGIQWNTGGNANTIAGNNFIGTTDATDLVVKTGSTERMRISSIGNIGIGTNAPYQKLTVQTAVNNYGMIHTDGTNSVGTFIDATSGQFGTLTNQPLSFFTWGQAPKLTLIQNGNVGIGTTIPQTDLHINPNGAGSLLIGTNRTSGGYTAIEMGISSQSNGYGYLQTTKASGTSWGNLIINQSGGTVGIGTTSTYIDTKLTVSQATGGPNYSGIAATASGPSPYAAIKAQAKNGADALIIDGPIRVSNTENRVIYQLKTQTTNSGADGYLDDNFTGLPGEPDGVITIRIDNPLSNGDPNAIIIYSFLNFYENNKNYQSYLIYDVLIQKWFIRYKYDVYVGSPSPNHSLGLNIMIIKQ